MRRPLATAFGGSLRSGHTFGSPSARGYAGRGRAGSSVAAPLRLPNGLAWTSIPASSGACRESLPNLAQMGIPPLGRGSRLSGGGASAFSLSRFAPSADSQRTRARRGDGRNSRFQISNFRVCEVVKFSRGTVFGRTARRRARFPPCGWVGHHPRLRHMALGGGTYGLGAVAIGIARDVFYRRDAE